jgi:hypothetical protein
MPNISKMTASLKELQEKTQQTVKMLMTKPTTAMGASSIIVITIVLLLFVSVLWWIYNKLTLDNKNCKRMNKLYKSLPPLHTISISNDDYSHNFRDYYIKTAYNCCSAGTVKNDFVNICALKNCIKQGVRCLDFEIYSVNNVPVISVSSQNTFDMKETYNSVPFATAMNILANYAFSSSTCPNPGDPLVIHLRIMSNNKPIYDKMANILYDSLSRRLLGKKFSYENNGKNFGTTPLKTLMGKVIVIVDKSNPLFSDTLLDEYVNIASTSVFMRALRFHDVKYTPDMQELIEYNKKHMSIVLPDLSTNINNPPATLSLNYGCQMVALSFQSFDASLEFYNEMFETAASAFVLKPAQLRYIPVTIPIPPPPNPAYSYETRPIKDDYYSFSI